MRLPCHGGAVPSSFRWWVWSVTPAVILASQDCEPLSHRRDRGPGSAGPARGCGAGGKDRRLDHPESGQASALAPAAGGGRQSGRGSPAVGFAPERAPRLHRGGRRSAPATLDEAAGSTIRSSRISARGAELGLLVIDPRTRQRLRSQWPRTALGRRALPRRERGLRELPQVHPETTDPRARLLTRHYEGRGPQPDARPRSTRASGPGSPARTRSSSPPGTLGAAPTRPTAAADPSFVRVLDERTLEFSDYPGNNMFNTLGNLERYPRAGLLFVRVRDRRSPAAHGPCPHSVGAGHGCARRGRGSARDARGQRAALRPGGAVAAQPLTGPWGTAVAGLPGRSHRRVRGILTGAGRKGPRRRTRWASTSPAVTW